MLKANVLMKQNIDALLRARHLSRKDLASWCRRGESWISKIMKEERREFPMKYWDRIADLLGVSTYQLLQPGIAPMTERRKGQRRLGRDRRLASQARAAVGAITNAAPADWTTLERLARLNPSMREAIEMAIADALAGQIPPGRRPPRAEDTDAVAGETAPRKPVSTAARVSRRRGQSATPERT